jgi:hypothetical protein
VGGVGGVRVWDLRQESQIKEKSVIAPRHLLKN